MKITIFFLASLISIQATAQNWGKFLKESGKIIKDESTNAAVKSNQALDSIDFQLVMSVNETAAFFDVKNKGEDVTKATLYALKQGEAKTDSETARDTLDHAITLYNLRLFKEAEIALNTAKEFMETRGLTNDVSYLRCISNIGLVYLLQGRVGDAEQSINTSLENTQRILGETSVGYAANLNSYAKLDQMNGKYNEAEMNFEASATLLKAKFGVNSMQYAIVENNKAMLYQTLGRYNDAIALMKDAIKNTEGTNKKLLQGKNSFDNRRFQSNLALLYQLSGDFVQAEATFLAIKKVFESKMQTNAPEYASLLDQVAILCMQMGKPELAEPNLQKALTIYKKQFGEENASYAKVLNDLGTLYRIQGKFSEAETALLKALTIRKTTLGENHPDYVKSVENLAVLYWKKGDLETAYTHFNEAMTKSLDFVSRYFPPMSEAEKSKYWDVLQPRFQKFYSFAVEASPTKPDILKDMFDYQIATKALLLNSTNKIKKAILASGDEKLIKDYLDWIGQKEQLSRYYALTKDELKEQKIDLQATEQTANAAERSLSQRSGDFSKAYATSKIGFQQVAGLLGETEAIVEIVRVRNFDKDFTDKAKYVVMVLTKGSTVPKMVVLEEGNELETKYAKYYKNTILGKLPDEFSYDKFWGKIDPLVAGKKILYLSPDGVYNQININTLKKPAGDYIENRFDVVTIGNSKDLISLKGRKAILKKNAFLLGFPDFGGAAVALPGTKVELDGIAKILKVSGYTVTQREQKLATEANIKAVKGPTLMHIATHGYFLPDAGTGSAMGVDSENAKNNPLLRSGLILAGAPDPEKSEQAADLQSNDNGILTAYEAMNLNLEGTDLIVLSACETGLGDVKAGEGVYGLQRAFVVAGANALIMSLWKVDDAATQMLMTNFYTNWTKSGNKLKAFKQAQLQLMVKYKEPYYWGAFVMMGQ